MANLAEVVNKHLGVMVPWGDVTEESLTSAITNVLGDSSYKAGRASDPSSFWADPDPAFLKRNTDPDPKHYFHQDRKKNCFDLVFVYFF